MAGTGRRRRFADCFGIDEVVLVGFDEGLNELQRDQPDLMAKRGKPSRHVIGAGTGFHRNGTTL